MQRAPVHLVLALAVAAGLVVEGVLLFLSWPLGVLTGVAGAALFTVIVGRRLQRDAADAPRSDLFDAIAAPAAPRRPVAPAPTAEPVAA